jgi:DNA anti-recombination protein RmuC
MNQQVSAAAQTAATAAVEAFKTAEAARADQEKRDKEAAELKEQGKFKELAEAKEQELADMRARLAKLEGGSIRDKIAAEFGFTGDNAALANAITGSTEAEMRTSAEGLKTFVKKPAAPNMDQGTRPNNPGAQPGDPAKPNEQARAFVTQRYTGPHGLTAKK